MEKIKITKGLNLPIEGTPVQKIEQAVPVQQVAVLGPDYLGMKPTMTVAVGDSVKCGQLLFSDKKTPGVCFTSPGAGKVVAINRGAKRALQSVVVALDGEEKEEAFTQYAASQLDGLSSDEVKENLVRSGLWVALRARPFGKTPSPDSTPHSIFVTAIDTHPLAPQPEIIIGPRQDDFLNGLKVLTRLGGEKVFLCRAPNNGSSDNTIPGEQLDGVTVAEFEGPHPAGLPGTHIHFLDPVGRSKTVWHLGYQDVLAIGHLFITGRLDVERVISLAGPVVRTPRLLKTRLGASFSELLEGELLEGENRVISGSVFSGRQSEGSLGFLGRYHQQISVLAEGRHRELFGWYMPGLNKYSIKNVVASKLFPGKRFRFTTTCNGGKRSIVPIGSYERMMPLDILPTFLLQALSVDDVERAEALGCLELAEDDLALCTFVCPGKGEYGSMLRRNLTIIEKEG